MGVTSQRLHFLQLNEKNFHKFFLPKTFFIYYLIINSFNQRMEWELQVNASTFSNWMKRKNGFINSFFYYIKKILGTFFFYSKFFFFGTFINNKILGLCMKIQTIPWILILIEKGWKMKADNFFFIWKMTNDEI